MIAVEYFSTLHITALVVNCGISNTIVVGVTIIHHQDINVTMIQAA